MLCVGYFGYEDAMCNFMPNKFSFSFELSFAPRLSTTAQTPSTVGVKVCFFFKCHLLLLFLCYILPLSYTCYDGII